MCFGGGGKGADEMYQEQKKDFGPLPSLKMTGTKSGQKSTPQFKDVKLTQGKRTARSLINPNMSGKI